MSDSNLVGDMLKIYGNAPLLTADEEKALSERIMHPKDKEDFYDARNELVTRNMRFVVSIAKSPRYQTTMSLADRIQEGAQGLMTAAEKYDYTQGTRFTTYAAPWIKQAIVKAIMNDRVIRYPAHIYQALGKLNKAKAELALKTGKEKFTDKELSDYLRANGNPEMTEAKVHELEGRRYSKISIDKPLSDDSEATIADLQADPTQDPEEYAENQMRVQMLKKAMESYPNRTQRIIQLRYGLNENFEEVNKPMTLDEIGASDELKKVNKGKSLTRERVRQICRDTINEIKRKYQLE